jgi:NAD(P)-dependent dehydrogenase (short-subunit alcohol dehydrogenase family)
MDPSSFVSAYDFSGKTMAITGGGGVLCGEMAKALAACHANVVILDRDMGLAEKTLALLAGSKGRHKALFIDVLDKVAIQKAADEIIAVYGQLDGLINGAGGNNPKATTNPEQSFFDIPAEALQFVSSLNLQGTILPCQVFGKCMVKQKEGVILNISSMNAFRPLTRIPAYSAAKAAVSNFTQWLLPHRPEPLPAHRQGDRRPHRPRQQDHRPHPDGTIRRPGGPGGRDAVAAVAGI